MFYVFSYETVGAVTEENTVPFSLSMTPGIIHQVDVLFQDGCDHLVNVQIWDKNFQVWPSNRGQYMRGNATVVSFREFYELFPANPTLTARIWDGGADSGLEVILQFGVLPKKIIQPLSFDQLLAAAAGIP